VGNEAAAHKARAIEMPGTARGNMFGAIPLERLTSGTVRRSFGSTSMTTILGQDNTKLVRTDPEKDACSMPAKGDTALVAG
jgi:hypothetical protein